MKRVLKFLAAFAIANKPAAFAGSLMLLGVGGTIISGMFTAPANIPQPASFFSNGNGGAQVNNGLKTPAGAFEPPAIPTNSMGILVEGSVSPGLGFSGDTQYALGTGATFTGLQVSDNSSGAPTFYYQKTTGTSGAWWNAQGFNLVSTAATSANGSAYSNGYYPFTATGGLCPAAGAREPSGVWGGVNASSLQTGAVDISDPGFLLCSVPTIALAAIPGVGAQQATLATSPGPTTCVGASPIAGNFTVTAHVTVPHGFTQGQEYVLSGFTPSGYNTTYLALPGTTGTTLVGMPATATTGTCPTSPATTEGVAKGVNGGTGGTITLPAISPIGATGITAKSNLHFCALVTENGDNSPFPGSQAIAAVDDHGNPLPGAPALVPILNQGTANFTGFLTTGTQSAGHLSLTVTAMNPYTITGATYSPVTGYVTFTTSTSPMFEQGSEFTVSGMTSTGANINLTYVAVAGTSITGTSIVGNPLSGPLGTPLAIGSPGTISTGAIPQMVSVIMPGMRVNGQYLTVTEGVISPFGTLGGTGTGGVGTYATSTTPPTVGLSFSVPPTGVLTTSGLTIQTLTVGTNFTGSDGLGTTSIQITGFLTGTGLNGTYSTNYTGGGTFVTTVANGVGTAGSPAPLFAVNPFYQTMAGVAGSTSFTTVPVAQASISDFINVIGSDLTTALAPTTGSVGWSGDLANITMLYMPGGFPAQTGGAPSTSALAGLCKKNPSHDIQQFAATNGFTVHSLYRLSDPGIWADSSVAQFTGSIAGTALSVSSTQTGSIGTQPTTPATVIAGAGITGCPSACPTIASGSGGSYVLSASGGTVASEAMTAGNFAPAAPAPVSAVEGWIDQVAGVPTLHVASTTTSSQSQTVTFTGTLNVAITASITGNVLTVTLPAIGNGGIEDNPYIGLGTTITIPGGTPATDTVAGFGTGSGATGTYIMTSTQPSRIPASGTTIMHASGILPGRATNLTVSGVTGGTIGLSMLITDGGVGITGPPLQAAGAVTAGDVSITPTDYPPSSIVADSMTGTFSTIAPGQYVLNSAITTPTKVIGYGTGVGLLGSYPLSACPNASCAVGSSGTPTTVFTTTGITDGAPVPTPALTVRDLGPETTLPITSSMSACTFGSCSATGSVPLSGTFDTSVIGGTPTTIQAQVSETAGGPPVSGCSACAWTTLSSYSAALQTFTASITTGGVMTPSVFSAPTLGIGQAFTGVGYSGTVTGINAGGQIPTYNVTPSPGSAVGPETMTETHVFAWSGSALNIPAVAGPLYVSVRASNGIAYAMLQNPIRIGLVFDGNGEGQFAAMFSAGQGGNSVPTYNGGLLGTSFNGSGGFFQAGPPIVGSLIPGSGQTVTQAADRFSVIGQTTAEGSATFQQDLTTATGGFSVWWDPILRDGIGIEPLTLGNIVQTQTVGVQNSGGTLTTWCSRAIFCSNPSPASTLEFNIATMSGGQITAKIDNGSGSAGNTLTLGIGARGSAWFGALEPGQVLTDLTGNITGSPTLLNCITGCVPVNGTSPTIPVHCSGSCYPNVQTWGISGAAQLVSSENMRADLPQTGGTPWPAYVQQAAYPVFTTFGTDLVQAGTFQILVNGTSVCQDTSVPLVPYNNQTGNCTDGSGNVLGWVNYMTNDYVFTPLSAPAANAVITAKWVNIISPDNGTVLFNRPAAYDFFGIPGVPAVGPVASITSKSPGGVSAHVFSGGQGVDDTLRNPGYPFGVGYSQAISWLYSVRYPSTIPGQSATAPVLFGHNWGWQGPVGLTTFGTSQTVLYNLLGQWFDDAGTPSTWTATVGSVTGGGTNAVMTLTSAAVGPMWEGEVVGCNPFSLSCAVGSGTYIQSIASGAWGANGSTYNLVAIGSAANLISAIGTSTAMMNATYVSNGFNIGPESDDSIQGGGLNSSGGAGPHGWSGPQGMGRIGRRMSCLTWGALTTTANCKAPFIDRVKADATGCDSSATTAPCFDIGNTFATTATSTGISGSTLTFNGLAAHAIPISDGQAVSCSSGCAGLFVVSVSNPQTQDARAGQGEIGSANNGFTVLLSGAPGGSNRAFTFGCSGTSGSGSNCIDIAYTIPTTGTYGTAASLGNCGENNANGNVPDIIGYPGNGTCQTNGIGSLVRNFAIGSNQAIWGGGAPVAGSSYYDDGINPAGTGVFNQNAAFTCHIVAAKVVQCVLGPTYSFPAGVETLALGKWPSGSTYVEQGDPTVGMSRVNALMGYVGGQSFPITSPGSGQTAGKYSFTPPFLAPTSATYTSSTGIVSMTFATAPFGATVGSTINGTNVTISNFLPSATNTAILGAGGTAVFPITSTGSSGTVINVQAASGLGTLSITNGSGNLAGCGTNLGSLSGLPPTIDFEIGSGGTLINAYPSTATNAVGFGNGAGCTFVVPAAAGGTPGTVTIPYGNFEGFGGMGSWTTDNNVKSVGVYDNTMLPGNPLAPFQQFCTTASRYCEPGLEAVPFGLFLGAQVSG